MDSTQVKQDILRGRTFLGIELGVHPHQGRIDQ